MAVSEKTEAPDSPTLFDAEFLQKLELLQLLSRKVFRGQMRGERTTPRRGHGLEFSDFRRYLPGDDFRYIDWNIFSRLDKLFLKLYTAEEDLTLYILVDLSGSMDAGLVNKSWYAKRLAAALAYVGAASMERVGIACFSDGLTAEMSPQRGRRFLAGAFRFLAAAPVRGETHFTRAVREFNARRRLPGLVMVISDLMSPEGYRGGLEALRRRGHEVVLIQLLSEEEIDPSLSGEYRLIDAETHGVLRISVSDELLATYRRTVLRFLEGVEEFCLTSQVEYLRASTTIPFEDVVLKYLRQGSHLR